MSSHSYKPDSYSDLASERIFESTIKKYRVLDSIQLIEYVKIVEIYLKQSSDSILFRRILLEDKYDVQVITVKLDNRMCVGHLFFQIPKAANKQLRKEYFSHGPVFESAFLYESFRVIYNERSNSITKYWLSGEEKN